MNLIDKDAVIAEIKKMVDGLQNNCNPNPLGNIQECLAAAEIEALNCAIDTIDALKTINLYHDAKDVNDNPDEDRDILLITLPTKKNKKPIYNIGLFSEYGRKVFVHPFGWRPLHIYDKWIYLDELLRLYPI